MEKIRHIKRIIDSCENLLQLKTCENFINFVDGVQTKLLIYDFIDTKKEELCN